MVIGVDLGGTKVRAGIAVNGSIQNQQQQLFNSRGTQQQTLGQLIDLIRPLMGGNIRGIGLGVPSVIDIDRGIVYNVVNIPSWFWIDPLTAMPALTFVPPKSTPITICLKLEAFVRCSKSLIAVL